MAFCIKAAVLLTSNFFNKLGRCVSIVLVLTKSCAAICLVVKPSLINFKTSDSLLDIFLKLIPIII